MRDRIKRKFATVRTRFDEESKEVKKVTVEKFATLITTGFGIVAAMAWNSAIQEVFKNNEWLGNLGPWFYAIIVTILAVFITVWISKLSAKLNKEAEEEEDTK